MSDLFPPFVAWLLGPDVEGSGSAGAGDPGGDTKWAVARSRHPEITDSQWAAWQRSDSESIIRSEYWDKNRCGEMPWSWALCICSGEVNQGAVIRFAQRALGLADDGIVGPATLNAIAHATDEHLAIFQRIRAQAYIANPRFSSYGNGWLDRLFLETIAAAQGAPA